ncbi:MAG TPA: methionyl-tRNA formyltransferase, partial [Gemmataceae bacterium]|nr:methionyl-tRNA formyltransferase [Gemmataceae bacterium]
STRQTGHGMANIARDHGIAVFQPESVNTPEGVASVKALQPDLLVVAAYGQILSKEVLATSPNGGINVHASLLPKYRGAAPVAWAIYHGETRTGVTIIKMSVHLDAGDILARDTITIGPDDTTGDVEARLAPLGARLALQVIDQIAAGTAQGIKQDQTQVTKAPKLTKEHGLIDWSRPARAICNHIRAMQPWPTAYTYRHRAGGEPLRLIIYKASSLEKEGGNTENPGIAILKPNDPDRLLVQAGQGSMVEVLQLQPAGKKRMSAAEFLRGQPLQPGDRFGPEQF